MTAPAIALDATTTLGSNVFQFDLTMPAGRIAAILGPSGSGKSTLLNVIAGFQPLSSGTIVLMGTPANTLAPSRRPVSMMFQDHNLFAHLDVRTNVALGVTTARRLDAAQTDQIAEVLARVGLPDHLDRFPDQLSGGERQRVALARCLLRDRPILLLDEPFAALGPALRTDMLALVGQLARERGTTVLMVTHRPEDAEAFADDAIFIDDRRILAHGPVRAVFDGDIEAVRRYTGKRLRP